MNYGKTAYLKVLDLERRTLSNNNTNANTNYIELTKQNLEATYTTSLSQTIEFNNINVKQSQDICFQIKAQIQSQNGGQTKLSLMVDNSIICQESKTLTSGENEIIIFKTFTPISEQTISISLLFESEQELFSATIQNIYLVVLGATSTTTTNSIELRAIKIPNQDYALISYIDSNNLYWTKTSLNQKTLSFDDFSYHAPAISHCFCPSKIDATEEEGVQINLYRVDPDKNLYYSNFLSNQSEQLLEKNVSVVHACPCPSTSDDTNLITYIKNNKCYFRTLRENVIVSEKSFSLPNGKYCDINAISHIGSSYVYVIATNSEGSNYILRSLIEVSTGKIIEIVKADYLLILSKYVDLSFIDDKCIEHINLNAKINLKSISFKEITNRLCRETINLSYSITPTSYDSSLVGKSITYGVRLDKSNAVATEWGTYTDDAQDLLPAYTDFNNSQFIDNGWLSRWPFNQIRPCIIKDEQIIGYLNPNDYTKFEDGTDAPITNRDSGFVMIEFPKIYYKLSSDDNYIDIKISDTMQEGFTCAPFIYKGVENSKLYVGAYLTLNSQFTTLGFESNSGVSLDQSASFIFSTAHKYLYNHLPNNYNFLTFDVLTLIQTLSIILFKATDIQRTLGCGHSSSPTSYVTGLLNTKGMYYGTNAFGTGTKLFGLEDFHSARPTLVCGVWVDESGYFRYADNSIDTNYTASGLNSFLNNNQACTIRSGLRIGDDIFGKNEMGYFFKEGTGTTNTKAFCDAYAITKNDFIDFGMPSSSYYNGIFSFKLGYRTTTHTKRAARLIYYPNK